MSPKSFLLTTDVHDYLLASSTSPDPVQQELIAETAALGGISGMQIAPEQGVFLTLLCQAVGARRVIEIGTFTGYSALCIARALPPGGTLQCCDVSEEWTAVARRYWEKAGVDGAITLTLGPALDTLRALPAGDRFDLAFIDADKPSYLAYYEELVPRMEPGGLILVDNTLWGGRVVDPDAHEPDTDAIRAFSAHVAADARTDTVLLPIGDGLTLCRILP